MWELLFYLNMGLIGGLSYYIYLNQKHKYLRLLVAGVVVLIFSLYQVHEQQTFELIHNNDLLMQQIDRMNPNELKNKMKACVVDSVNCKFVFVG